MHTRIWLYEGTSGYVQIREEVVRMRRLGMTLRSIGGALGVDEKTVRRALGS